MQARKCRTVDVVVQKSEGVNALVRREGGSSGGECGGRKCRGRVQAPPHNNGWRRERILKGSGREAVDARQRGQGEKERREAVRRRGEKGRREAREAGEKQGGQCRGHPRPGGWKRLLGKSKGEAVEREEEKGGSALRARRQWPQCGQKITVLHRASGQISQQRSVSSARTRLAELVRGVGG